MIVYELERNIHVNDWFKVRRPDGSTIYIRVTSTNDSGGGTANNPNNTAKQHYSDTFGVDIVNSHRTKHILNWHNCYSFGNGVESNRIADIFNTQKVTPGVKVSTIFEDYEQEHRKHGLIYSGIYNSTSGINNLNQFVQAEKITKDINPIYGSIQKLHARDTDLITLCEDKVLRILANKDAVYNADGNTQLTATDSVLGQTVPFIGEYGISKNPESFVSEAYRSYFTDKQRGTVMRLSRDGLTPISMHGMKDWFRDNLSTSKVNLLGENNLDSKDNWDSNWATLNVNVEGGVATIGYYNNYVEDNRYGNYPWLVKNNILEVGKKYRIQLDVLDVSGLKHEVSEIHTNLFVYNAPNYYSIPGSNVAGSHVTQEFTATHKDFFLFQHQVNTTTASGGSGAGNYTPPGGTLQTIQEFVGDLRGEVAGSYTYPSTREWLYGGIVTIANIVLDEVKVEPKIVGSYDDRQDEYNVTIHSAIPKTVSFREDVKGWVSFKSFFPENAISCANDYYTVKDGKLWQHHVQGANNNTFYGVQTNSSVNVILNDAPGSMKSFHALDYEGSQSRVEGIRTAEVTGIEHSGGAIHDGRYFFFEKEDMSKVIGNHDLGSWDGTIVNMKQYRNNILIHSGSMKLFNDPSGNSSDVSPSGGPTKGHGRYEPYSSNRNWQVGDVITTEEQEKTVNHFNSMPKDGWWVSGIETDKQKGNLPDFIEKEGKWFNHVKGIDSEISETTNFGSFDIQGVGIVEDVIEENMVKNGNFSNSSDWVLSSGWTITNGKAVANGVANNFHQNVNLTSDKAYIVTYTVSGYDKGAIRVILYSDGKHGWSPGAGGGVKSSNGTFTENIVTSNSGGSFTNRVHFQTYNSIDNDFKIDNVSVIPVEQDVVLSFTDNINSSLQIGDTLYFERPSEVLDIGNLIPSLNSSNWIAQTGHGITADYTGEGVLISSTEGASIALYPVFYSNDFDLVDGKEYQLDIIISDYDNGGDTSEFIRNYIEGTGDVEGSYRPLPGSSPSVIEGKTTYSFVFDKSLNNDSNTVRFQVELTGGNAFSKSVRLNSVSLRELTIGGSFGFTRLESDNIQKAGVVTGLTSNTVTIDITGGVLPSANDYILFSKNQAVNTSSLLGYYADVKLENDSINKAELFSVGAEITESSK